MYTCVAITSEEENETGRVRKDRREIERESEREREKSSKVLEAKRERERGREVNDVKKLKISL